LLISGLVYTVSASTNTTKSTDTSSTQPVDNDDTQEEVQLESQADDAVEISTPEQPEAIETPETADTPETDGVNDQNPSYTASVSAPKDATDEQLGALAKITPEDAIAAAMQDPKLAGGAVNHVELDDENGNVVYSVEVTVGSIVYDAKVDAGTGILLYIDQ
jgi:uncharacterized membrane protein YkoI